MKGTYDFKEVEPRIGRLWEEGAHFTPRIDKTRRPYSMFLVPPNASGPLHVGNALMIAIQDIVARYHRAKGEPTLWIPGTDHGGYETQVTFEREVGKENDTKNTKSRKEIFKEIESFVARNNKTIIRQIKAMGASVDWSRLRFTLDEYSLASVARLFKKMVSDNLVYRSSYMVNYCTSCATVLADIELKESQTSLPLYFIKFLFENGDGYLTIATTKPEFIFAITHVLVHPQDNRFAKHIGKSLVNPASGEKVHIIESKRKYDPTNQDLFLLEFSPSHNKYDFEYALRNALPVRDLLNWEGVMNEQYPTMTPSEARKLEVERLMENDSIERVDDFHIDSTLVCKKGHTVQNVIRMTWFLKLDNEKTPLRKPVLDALKEGLIVYPHWRKKGLVEWLGKMHDWPIARQNVWGITIPIWYEITDPGLFTVWFLDEKGLRRYGNLKMFLDEEISLETIAGGLERIYAAEGCSWTLEKESGKTYLPETDTFDTWFSSSAWSTTVFEPSTSPEFSYFYPSNVVIIGHDLLRLSISRKLLFGHYLTGRLPFKRVYFHQLIKGADGQKMSKSLGNAITLDHYLEKFGADVTRMALVSYTGLKEDFIFSDERLAFFSSFSNRLWRLAKVSDIANIHSIGDYKPELLSPEDKSLLSQVISLGNTVDIDIEKYSVAQAQEKLVLFLEQFEEYFTAMKLRSDGKHAVAVFHSAFNDYLTLLHPFMPFMTEEIHMRVYKASLPLAATQREIAARPSH